MSDTERDTSFGQMTTLERHGHTVEILRFDREGKDHTHHTDEHAVCLSGDCALVVNGIDRECRSTSAGRFVAEIGRVYVIPAGAAHRMRPLTDEPSVWLLWYSDPPEHTEADDEC